MQHMCRNTSSIVDIDARLNLGTQELHAAKLSGLSARRHLCLLGNYQWFLIEQERRKDKKLKLLPKIKKKKSRRLVFVKSSF